MLLWCNGYNANDEPPAPREAINLDVPALLMQCGFGLSAETRLHCSQVLCTMLKENPHVGRVDVRL